MTSTLTRTTDTVTSADGTRIAYEVTGSGPALVLVDGAMCQRTMGPSRGLAAELAEQFTVYAYDRRGRGDSGPGNSPWELARELDDLNAVLSVAGAGAHLFGASSGAALVLEAARNGGDLGRVVAYEAPFIVDDTKPANDPRLPDQVQAMVDSGRRSEAVKIFLRTVGLPAPVVALMPLMPAWKSMTGVAHNPALRPDLGGLPPAGAAAARGRLRRGGRADAGDRRREEPGLHAECAGRDRGRGPGGRTKNAGRTDPHDQAQGAGAGDRGVPQSVNRARGGTGRDFDALVQEGLSVPTTGWDFSWFDGRAIEGRPPWAYQALLAGRLVTATSALDLQTGGGEVLAGALARSAAPPQRVAATEAWPPNVPLARAALRPWGGAVVECADAEVPFAGETFDLVSARHPIVTPWSAIARVLVAGGMFLSQQVGGGSVGELTEAMVGAYEIGTERAPETARRRAEAAGLEVVRLETASLPMRFDDIAVVIVFLRKVIWIVPGFTVEAYRPQLRQLHDQIEQQGPFVATSERFLIECRRL